MLSNKTRAALAKAAERSNTPAAHAHRERARLMAAEAALYENFNANAHAVLQEAAEEITLEGRRRGFICSAASFLAGAANESLQRRDFAEHVRQF